MVANYEISKSSHQAFLKFFSSQFSSLNRDGIDEEVALSRILFEPHQCSGGRKEQENAYNKGTLNLMG